MMMRTKMIIMMPMTSPPPPDRRWSRQLLELLECSWSASNSTKMSGAFLFKKQKPYYMRSLKTMDWCILLFFSQKILQMFLTASLYKIITVQYNITIQYQLIKISFPVPWCQKRETLRRRQKKQSWELRLPRGRTLKRHSVKLLLMFREQYYRPLLYFVE